MARKNKGKKAAKTPSKEKQKILRILFVLLIIGIFVAAVTLTCWGLSMALFSKNEHFVLRRLELNGLAPERTTALAKYLGLELGKDNLFDIDIAAVRRKVAGISYIREASVYRVLPDTLKINITQRVPLAYLLKFGSAWVIDEDCVVMNRKYCMKVRYTLPVIRDFKHNYFNSGDRLPQLEQGVELIKLSACEFSEFKISSLDLSDDQKIPLVMIYKRHAYKVIMPRENLRNMMVVLRESINNKQGKYKSTIDLTYHDQVIFR